MAVPGGIISPELDVIFKAIDQLSAETARMQGAIESFSDAVKGAAGATQETGESSEKMRITMRGVALDLRMISIATAIFRREVGTTNPVVELFSRGLLIVSTSATAAMATVDLLQKATVLQGLTMASVTSSLQRFGSAVIGFLTNPITLAAIAVIAAVAAVVTLAQHFSPAQVAARYFADEMERLKQAADDAKSAMEVLQYQMEGLNITQQRLRIREQELQYAIQRRGYATAAETAELAALQASQDVTSLSMEQFRLKTMETEHALRGYEMRTADLEKLISSLPQYGWAPGYVPQVPERPSPEQLMPSPYGQMGFPEPVIAVKPADIFEKRGRPLSVLISFPNATFSTSFDVRQALMTASEEASMEIKRRL